MNKELFLGVDVGSSSAKAVVLNEKREIVVSGSLNTDPDYKVTLSNILELIKKEYSVKYNNDLSVEDINYSVGTGESKEKITYARKLMTEISCDAKGIQYYLPRVRTVIDIGGNYSRVITINDAGGLENFAVNEKCAAGSGKFLEVLCDICDTDLETLGSLSIASSREEKISSMCAVFAESEVITKIAEGAKREDIIRGVHSAIAFRVLNMGKRLGLKNPIAFIGGVAKNSGMAQELIKQAGLNDTEIFIPPDPQIIGALGAALFAMEEYTNAKSVNKSSSNELEIMQQFEEEISAIENKPTTPLIGWTDLSVPVELLMAAGLKSIRVRGDIDKGASSDEYMRTYSCAYIKNSVSALLEESAKYKDLSGIIVTNCCTATERMLDILEYDKKFANLNIFSLTIPRKDDDYSIAYMRNNIVKLKDAIEKKYAVQITEEGARKACDLYNQFKQLMNEYSLLLAKNNFPNAAYLVGLQMEKLWINMDLTPELIADLQKKIEALKVIPPLEKHGPNILLSGSIIPEMGFYDIFRGINCQVVYNDTSSGNRFSESMVDVNDSDIFHALARRCLYPGYGPRTINIAARMDNLKKIIDKFQVEAIVFNISKFCVHYTFEAVLLREYCGRWNLPLLVFETDFASKKFGHLKSQVEAFVEIVKNREEGKIYG